MVKEALPLLRSMSLDDQEAIHIPEKAGGLVGCPVKRHLLQLLHVEFGNNQRTL
jgi:hypothetical protein